MRRCGAQDWDADEDGDWEAPLVKNPDCEKFGCGEWAAPVISNPDYKGKWYAKNKEGEASGPFKDKDGAEAYAKGEKKEDKKEDKPKKKASRRTHHSKGIERLSDRDLAKLFREKINHDKLMEKWNRGGPMWGGPHMDDWSAFHAEAEKRGIKLASEAPTLKGRLAKLAFDNPDMREALLPLLKD